MQGISAATFYNWKVKFGGMSVTELTLLNELEAEIVSYFDECERKKGNKRNSKGKKTIKSSAITFHITTPTDKSNSLEPEIVKKRQTILADNLSDRIIGLYGLGMSYRDISSHIKERHDTDISQTI